VLNFSLKEFYGFLSKHPDRHWIVVLFSPLIFASLVALYLHLGLYVLHLGAGLSDHPLTLSLSGEFDPAPTFGSIFLTPVFSLSSISFLIIDLLAELVGLFLPGIFVDLTYHLCYCAARIWLDLFFDFFSVLGFSSFSDFILSGGPMPKSLCFYPGVILTLNESFFQERFLSLYYGEFNFDPVPGLLTMVFFFLSLLTFTFAILLSIAFLTVLERKALGAAQRREGPTQVGPFGFFQAIADALKLLSKENLSPTSSNQLLFFLFPTMIFSISLLIWASVPILPNSAPLVEFDLLYLFVFSISTLHVYFLAFAAWSGTSRYPFTGSIRTIAQMLSYDVVLALALAPALLLSGTLNLVDLVEYQAGSTWLALQAPISFILFCVVSVAETNRPPFDLPEAESELVAGSLTEYASTSFVFLFIAEYSHILLSCHLLVLTFLGGWHLPFFDFFLYLSQLKLPFFSIWIAGFLVYQLKLLLAMLLFFLTRAALPRYRYDQLMELAWKRLLPIAIANLVLTAVWVFLI
jgi:NADH-quinone oxidoreductase subunit H